MAGMAGHRRCKLADGLGVRSQIWGAPRSPGKSGVAVHKRATSSAGGMILPIYSRHSS